ncbi:hypothetical protein ACIRO3_26720 [Streptomyces sp. NPDC102278]|uniref:hypothetical protein n=1 Tax=Streptomyces sp. NPDC102278 TaxID=3366152 RepID=UPI00380D60F5
MRPIGLVLAAAVPLVGCGAPAVRVEGAQAASRGFEQALAARDFVTACDLTAPETRAALEEGEKQRCSKALAGQGLPVSHAMAGVEVYGRQAMVRLDSDTLFLSQFEGGWKVVAAGCRPRGDKPYRCTVKGG